VLDAEQFRNRKGYFSINVQTVCDSELRVLDCVARWPGATHDQRIFNESTLCRRLERGDFGCGLVVGDSGYENRSYLVTPLLSVNTPGQNLYNEATIRTRNPVERKYGVMKRRFPVLAMKMRGSLRRCIATIVAVMILHNIALHDPLPTPQIDINIRNYEFAKIAVERLADGNPDVQKHIIENYFNKLV